MTEPGETTAAAIADELEAAVRKIQSFEGRIASGWLLLLDMRSMDDDGATSGVSIWHPKDGLPLTQAIGMLRVTQISYESAVGDPHE